MGIDKWLLLNRLRRTVKKIRLLLNFNLNKWRIASNMARSKRRVSFNDRPGLKAAFSNDDHEESNHSRELQRSTSYPLEDDVDKRADLFIANFYKQLKMERQVSLQLRYLRGDSFDSSVSP